MPADVGPTDDIIEDCGAADVPEGGLQVGGLVHFAAAEQRGYISGVDPWDQWVPYRQVLPPERPGRAGDRVPRAVIAK